MHHSRETNNLINTDNSTAWFNYNNRLARFRMDLHGVDYWRQHWERDGKRTKLDVFVSKNSLGEYKTDF